MDRRIETSIKLIEDSISRKLTLDDLAQSVNLSASRLRHLFKAEVGTTPTQYLKSRKMQEAKNLMGNSYLTMKQVMIEIGVSDVSHFVRDFKMAFGLTPTQYRSNHPDNNSSNKR